MLRIWGKMMKGSHMLRDMVAANDNTGMSNLARVEDCLDQICQSFDLPRPIWMEKNIQDLNSFGKTEFRQDNFVEHIPFQYLEIEIIEMEK